MCINICERILDQKFQLDTEIQGVLESAHSKGYGNPDASFQRK